MSYDDTLLDELIRAAGHKSHEAGAHLSAEDLALYHLDQASPELTARVRSHIADCGECARALLDLAEFPIPSAAQPAADLEQVDAEWREIEEKMGWQPETRTRDLAGHGPGAAASAPGADSLPGGLPGSGKRTFDAVPMAWPLALAAVVLIALGLGIWGLGLKNQSRALEQRLQVAGSGSLANLPIFKPNATGEGLTRGAPEQVLLLPSDAPGAFLYFDRILAAGPLTAHIRPGQDQAAVEFPLRPQTGGLYTLQLARELLPPGTLSIELSSAEGPIATYRIQVRHSD